MSRKLVIGLIGGIGAGKSAAADALARRGGHIVSGDEAGHAALIEPAVRNRVIARWPQAVGPGGAIDRKVLGRIVFADAAQLKELEGIVFPWIKDRLHQEIETAQTDDKAQFVVLDAAVMLEAGWEGKCDKIVFVDAPRAARVARVAARGWSAADLDRRERAQFSLGEKKKRSDAVLDNSKSVHDLQKNVDGLLAQWGLAAQPV